MPTYLAPTADQIIAWTGLNQFIRGDDGASFGEWLESLIPQAEAEVAVMVDANLGEGSFDGDWPTRKVLLLTQAVAYYAAAAALVSPQLQLVTGTEPPLLMEDPEAMAKLAGALRGRGEDLASLVTSGIKAEPTFSLPSIGSSTFDSDYTDPGPVERNEQLDERGGRNAFDQDRVFVG